MKRFFQKISLALCATSIFIFSGIIYAQDYLPETYNVSEIEVCNFDIFPYKATLSPYATENKDFKNMDTSLKLFNLFPIKAVNLNPTSKKYVIPCGIPFGAKIYTNGVMVIEDPELNSSELFNYNLNNHSLRKGDIILEANGEKLTSTENFEKIVENSGGKEINLTVQRNSKKISINLSPVYSQEDKKYYAGVWVRDSSAGVGTMTFLNPIDKSFAGLGHGICDVDTGNILSLAQGTLTDVSIIGINKAKPGDPGELKGCFTGSFPLGEIYSNSDTGVYGKIMCNIDTDIAPIEVAMKQNVKRGPAKILTTIDGHTPHFYDINIDSVNYNVNCPTKNIKVTVTDPALLEKTGGIIQGMSGSPILQNGILAGAITHVLVNEPTKGYGIFAETMLSNCDKVLQSQNKNQ